MRIRGLFIAVVVAMSATVFAQDQAPAPVDQRNERIVTLEAKIAEQQKQIETLITQAAKPKPPEPTADEKKAQARVGFAKAYKQAKESAELGCKDSGGKLDSITLDNKGAPSATCKY